MLKLLNILFHIVHIVFILFVIFGWIVEPLRIAHLILCGLILLSWFGIGICLHRPGFCLITEIQYQIRHRMGIQNERQSYMVYLGETLTGHTISVGKVEIITQAVFYLVIAMSVGSFFRGMP